MVTQRYLWGYGSYTRTGPLPLEWHQASYGRRGRSGR